MVNSAFPASFVMTVIEALTKNRALEPLVSLGGAVGVVGDGDEAAGAGVVPERRRGAVGHREDGKRDIEKRPLRGAGLPEVPGIHVVLADLHTVGVAEDLRGEGGIGGAAVDVADL